MASILAKMGLDTKDFSQKLERVEGRTKKFADKFGSFIKSGVKIASVAIGAFAVKGIKDLVEFDKKINEVFTLMPDISQKSMGKMQDDVRRLATTMGVDLTDAVNGLYQAISAGVDPDNAVSFLETASKTAIAGVASLEDSVGALTTILNGYGMEVREANKVSDVLFSVVKNGVTTMTELGQNIGKVTPIASALGVEIDEVGAMFATLTKQMGSGKTAEAGTAIRSMLAELAKAGMKASDNFKEIAGVSFPEFIKSGGSVQEALMKMKNHAEANNMSLMDMFRGIEAGNGALMLVTNSGKELSKNLNKINADAGATETAFERMQNTLSVKFTKMMATFKEVGMKFAEAFMPIIEKHLPAFTQGMIKAIPNIVELGKKVAGAITGFIKLSPLIIDIVAGLTAFTIGAKASSVASKALGKNVKSLALPLTALYAGFKTGKALGDLLAKVVKEMRRDFAEELKVDWIKTLNKDSQQLAGKIQTLDDKILAMRKSLGLIEKISPFKEIEKLSLREQVNELDSMVNSSQNLERSMKSIKEDLIKQHKAEQDILAEMIQQGASTEDIAKQTKKVLKAKEDVQRKELSILKEMEKQEQLGQKLVDAERDLAEEIKRTSKEFADRDAERNRAIAKALFLEEDIATAITKVHDNYKLSETALGRIQILQNDILTAERDKNDLIDQARTNRGLEKDEASRLSGLEQTILDKRKDLRNLLRDEINKIRADELKIVQDQVAEMQKLLDDETERARQATKNKEAKLAEVDALRAELKVAEDGLEPLKKFFQKDFKGKITPNYAEMHREFKKLKEEGKLPPNVETLRDFREMLTTQASAQKLARDAIIEKGKIAMADAQALADEEATAIANKESLEKGIVSMKEGIIKAEAEHEKLIAVERKKNLTELSNERKKLEEAFKKLGDIDLTINTDQKGHLANIENLMGQLANKNPANIDLKTTEDRLYDIHNTLTGKFINQ